MQSPKTNGGLGPSHPAGRPPDLSPGTGPAPDRPVGLWEEQAGEGAWPGSSLGNRVWRQAHPLGRAVGVGGSWQWLEGARENGWWVDRDKAGSRWVQGRSHFLSCTRGCVPSLTRLLSPEGLRLWDTRQPIRKGPGWGICSKDVNFPQSDTLQGDPGSWREEAPHIH